MMDAQSFLTDLINDLQLLRRGFDLAERRERIPSYRMELQDMVRMCDYMLEDARERLAEEEVE